MNGLPLRGVKRLRRRHRLWGYAPKEAGADTKGSAEPTQSTEKRETATTAPFFRLSDNLEINSIPADAKGERDVARSEHKKIPGKTRFTNCVQSHQLGKKSVVPTTTSSTSQLPRFTSVAIHRARCPAQAAAVHPASVMSLYWASDQPPIDTLTVADQDRKRKKACSTQAKN